MKTVVAIVQPQQLPAVKRSLFDANIKHITCTNVLGTAPEGATLQTFRGVAHEVSLFQKVRIELVLRDEMVDRCIDAIVRGAEETGSFGVIYVTEACEFVNIRTGERGERALR